MIRKGLGSIFRYEDGPSDFIERVVTQDETWVHHFDPNAEQTMESAWLNPPKKCKRVHSAGKVMTSIFWDIQGVIMIDNMYLEQGRTINGAYYAGERSVLLLQDNAPTHTSQVAMPAPTKCGFEILPYPHILLIWLHLNSICSKTEISSSWYTVWKQ